MKEQEPKEEEELPIEVLKEIYFLCLDKMMEIKKNRTFLEEMKKKQEKGGKCPPLP